ncbi:anhydro-N-acetylmuramic acid kinase [Roseospirillum parvum]|uniref:Anhydro-N-acetylmuramic acid kinase n=1 Tax=Roseospirillum parvum TaxID=83401 RepID=A0A1G7XVK2_9PROT|nr:anhydro-N-acetylmuramic acid kinase [Roseospirillum parvum]SDG88232.1 anhydro-N-acetylmuramic acid kinase [Roseospirillum parvum]
MPPCPPLKALGLMSGTSLDGVDAAIVETDGTRVLALGPSLTQPYPADLADDLRAALGSGPPDDSLADVERRLTLFQAAVASGLIDQAGPVEVVGFHGQTVNHRPQDGWTWQLGDGALMAARLGVPVVSRFRDADVAAGGEGAPLAPAWHRALAADLERPLAVLNLGGVGNVTWIGPGDDDLIAFDTGPGNALLDDWVRAATGQPCDRDGALARAGRVEGAVLGALMDHPYFARPWPKSLDRNAFSLAPLAGMELADGAATLAAFTAQAVARAVLLLPQAPRRWLITGGGRHNPALMAELAARLAVPVEPVEVVGWDGDALEAQAFAYLAARALAGLALSFPGTTGVARPLPGGRISRPPPG